MSEVLLYSNLLLLPSETEGMPTVLMEAITYDLPIITYLIPGPEDIIKNNMNGYIHKVGDISGLENSILKIFNSNKNLFKQNYFKLATKFNRKNIINKIYIFYEQLLNR